LQISDFKAKNHQCKGLFFTDYYYLQKKTKYFFTFFAHELALLLR